MSDKWFNEMQEGKAGLYAWVLAQMSLGAAYAAAVFFGCIAIIVVLRLISRILPEDPYAALDTGLRLLS